MNKDKFLYILHFVLIIILLILIFKFISIISNKIPENHRFFLRTSGIPIIENRYDNIIQTENDKIIESFIKSNIKTPNINIKKPEEYFTKLESHANDSQNTHDSTILSSLTMKYKRLKELYDNKEYSNEILKAGITEEELNNAKIDEIIFQIKKLSKEYYNNEEKQNKINNILDEISKNNTITSISEEKIPVYEKYILLLVWTRIHHKDNEENMKKMEIMLLDQLIDCYESIKINIGIINVMTPEHSVCINGRVGRIISSLTLLDNDKILSDPEKDEKEIANLAYSKAYKILTTELKKNKRIDELYNTNHDKLSDDEFDEVIEFENKIKLKIERELTNEYKNYISSQKLKNIIEKAKQGI